MTPFDRSKTTVMITGAGISTRMKPLTDNIHKIMLPIAPGVPMLQHVITLMKDQGFSHFVINTHYLPHTITEYFGDGEKFGVQIKYSHEEELLEVGGGVKKAEELLSDPFVLLYGDHLHFLNFESLIKLYQEKQADGVVALSDAGNPLEGEVVELSEEGRIIKWHVRPHTIEKTSSRFLRNAGLYILSKKILEHIPENTKISLDREVMDKVIEKSDAFYGFKLKEPFVDVGTPERYEYAKKWYQEQLKKKE